MQVVPLGMTADGDPLCWGGAGCVVAAMVSRCFWLPGTQIQISSGYLPPPGTCFQGSSCLTTFQMFLMSKCVANGMKIITREIEAVGRRDMSKSLWYVSVVFINILMRPCYYDDNNIKECCVM